MSFSVVSLSAAATKERLHIRLTYLYRSPTGPIATPFEIQRMTARCVATLSRQAADREVVESSGSGISEELRPCSSSDFELVEGR
jgi:hypothetical protein